MPTGNFVAVVVKRLHVVEAFGGQTEVSLADLAAGNHVVKSSVYRILYTLNQLGYVEKLPAGCYSLTARWNHLAGAAQPPENLIAVASPLMTKLLAQFHETVNLGILHGPEVLYIHVLENPHRLRLSAHAGMRSPIHSTALGKCLLSSRSEVEVKVILKQRPRNALTLRTTCGVPAFTRDLDQVRSQGIAVDNGADCLDARCVAAPIVIREGEAIAAISISGPASRIRPNRDRELGRALKEACRQISTTLSYTSTATQSRVRGGR